MGTVTRDGKEMSSAWPVLMGQRVVLGLAGADQMDAHRLLTFHAHNEEHLTRWLPPRPSDFLTLGFWERWTGQSLTAFEVDSEVRLLIRAMDNPFGDIFGQINFNTILRGAAQSCAVGYHIAESAQGKGLMSEALDLAVSYMFDQRGMHRVTASHLPENERSARMLERLGFKGEGLARAFLFINGAWRDHVVTAKINDEGLDPVPGAAL